MTRYLKEESRKIDLQKSISSPKPIVPSNELKNIYPEEISQNNKTIQAAIKPNATFVPIDDANLNVLPDNDGSYNCFLQTVIFSYLKACLNINKEPNVNEFTFFVEQLDINSYCDGDKKKKNVGYFKKTLLGKLYGEDDIKMIEESLGIGNSGRKLTKVTK